MGAYLSTANTENNSNALTEDEICREYLQALNESLGIEGDLEVECNTTEEEEKKKEVRRVRAKIHEEYFKLYADYVTQFSNELVVILYQVGAFYEMYRDGEKGPDVWKVSKITGITSIDHTAYPGLKLLGFPIRCLPKYRDLLLRNNYNVVVMNQIGTATKNKEIRRVVSSIHTPGSLLFNNGSVKIHTSETDEVQSTVQSTVQKQVKSQVKSQVYGRGKRHLQNVFVKCPTGKTINYSDVFLNDTIETLKEKISKSINIDPEKFFLLYHGRTMAREDSSLEDYGFCSDHTIEVRLRNTSLMEKRTRSGRTY